MSSISSLGSSMSMMMNTMAMQRPDQQKMFNNVDTDSSGTVDQSELTSFAEGLYEKTGIEINTEEALSSYDTDADGGLSREEMEAMLSAYMPSPGMMSASGGGESQGGDMGPGGMPPPPPPDGEEMFSSIDTDGSGTVDETELASFVDQLAENTGIEIDSEEALSTYDTDGDGVLSEDEMKKMMSAYMPTPPDMSASGEESTGTGMGASSMPPPPPDGEEMFSSIDTDGSGTVDETELASFVDQLAENTGIEIDSEEALSTYDADGDGVLAEDEVGSMMAANMPPPPSAPASQVIAAYTQNSSADNSETISQLMSLFSTGSDSNAQSALYTPFKITA